MIYLSAFGTPALKALAGDNAEVVIHGEKIPLLNISKNPKLIKEIDQFQNSNTPIDILRSFQKDTLEYGNSSLMLTTLHDDAPSIENKAGDKFIFLNAATVAGKNEIGQKLYKKLKDSNLNLNFEDNLTLGKHEYKDLGMPLEKFVKNKDKITDIISGDLGIPNEVVGKYIDQYLMPDTSRISLVPFNNFTINKDLKMSNESLILNNKIKELYQEYHVFEFFESGKVKGVNKTNNLKAWNELEKWGREKGLINATEDVDSAMYKERINYEKSPNAIFEKIRDDNENFNNETNFDKFEELFLNDINKSGESLEHLKVIAKDNPEEVIKITAKILDENIAYDFNESTNINNKDYKSVGDKHALGIPYITLATKLGVCHDYASTFVAAKYVLEKNGVPNMDKYAVLYTVSNDMNHAWDNLLRVNKKGDLEMTSIDLTWADDENISKIPEKLNSVDKDHFYLSEVDKVHQEALKKILEFNAFVEEEKLREIMTTLTDTPRAEIPKTAEIENVT